MSFYFFLIKKTLFSFPGAGIFVTTVVAGSVAMVRPFHAMERPFLRDIVFYLLAVFMTFFVLYSGITLGRAVGKLI